MFKKSILMFALIFTAATVLSFSQKTKPAAAPATTTVTLKTQLDSLAYAIGMDIGKNLKNQEINVNPDMLAQGLSAVMNGTPTAINENESQQTIQAFFMAKQAKDQEKKKAEGEANKIASEKFLAENKTKPGIKTTASGLQYEVIKEGTGKQPVASDNVKVHYEGKTIDGNIFDSSIKRGEPIEFPLNGVIKGWTEGVQLMKEGGKIRLYIPSELGYGAQGAGGSIGPNQALIFDVELLEVKASTPAPDKK